MRRGRRAQLPESSATHWVERLKASVRAKVEHPFCTIKRQFGYGKVRTSTARTPQWLRTSMVGIPGRCLRNSVWTGPA